MHELTRDAILKAKSILDIGANVGQSVAEYKAINKDANILSIEANPACENELSRISDRYLIAALGADEIEKTFFVNKDEPTCQGASFFREQTYFYREGNIKTNSIKTVKLDDLVGDEEFEFIKIDTQGSELPIILGGKKTIAKAKWVLVETPVIEYNQGSASFDQISEAMRDLGFSFAAVDRENRFSGQVVQKDVLFKNTKNKSEIDLSNNLLIGGKFEALRDAFLNYMPDCYVEIGCFRLNTAINLMNLHMPKEAYLFDLFEKAPDYEMPPKQPPCSITEAADLVRKSISDPSRVSLIKGDSNKTFINFVNKINETKFDCVMVFIDGGHSYITTIKDMINASCINHRMIIAVDDADWPDISIAISDLLKIIRHRNPTVSNPLKNLVIIDINASHT